MKKFIILFVVLMLTGSFVFCQWTTTQLSNPRSLATSTGHESKIYIAGGANYSANQVKSTIDIYDVSSGGWSVLDLSQARFVMASAATSQKVLFAGGVLSITMFNVSDLVDIYNPQSNTWQTATLSEARGALSATSNGQFALFAGGIKNFISGATSTKVDIYDESSETWSVSQLSVPRGYFASVSAGGKAYFAGGIVSYSGNSSVVTNRVDIYDYASGTWSIDSLSVARGGLAASACGDYILFCGGHDSQYNALNTVDIYNMQSGEWTTDTLSQARGELTAASLNNKLFFGGGYSDYNELIMSDRVDVFDTDNATWDQAGLSQPRSELTAASAGNTILFSGGGSYSSGLEFADVDVYTEINTGNINSTENKPVIKLTVISYPKHGFSTIEYTLIKDAWVKLKIFDLTGCELAELVNQPQEKDSYSVKFNLNDHRNFSHDSIFICGLWVDGYLTTKKFVYSGKGF
ncbi:MAG: hypothetical protein K9G76_03570 [Bacteroidales bacterium]|nr:hypothetical protein [Bacteroidales bacterium]MCF8402873.1 hypothetical protein [Bacteroidales bacterium]